MKPQEMIGVIQAHADGKQIEFREAGGVRLWTDCSAPMFDFAHFEYRVKPVTLRPHWPAIVQIRPAGRALITDALYADVEVARDKEQTAGTTVIRLATEYPPLMLP